MAKGDLTERQRRFAEEYVKDRNAVQAALRAGYAEGTAKTRSHALTQSTAVQAEIQRLTNEQIERINIDSDRIKQEQAALAFSNIKDFATWTETRLSLKPSDEIDYHQARCIKSVKETKDGVQIELYDKRKALADLARLLGLEPPDGMTRVLEAIGESLRAEMGE